MDSPQEKPRPESEEVRQWLVCPICKQPNPAGALHCQHCWGASLYSVKPVTSKELEVIMVREQTRSRRRNLIKIVSVSILAPLLLSTAVFLAIYSLTDLILAPSPTLNSSPLPGEWTMFRHDLSRSGSINPGSSLPQGTLKWSFSPKEEELKAIQTAMETMMAEKSLTSVEETLRTDDMLAFPAGNPLYPQYLALPETKGRYSCDSAGLVKQESYEQGLHSSPAVVGGIVYFGARDSALYALDADTGTKLWEFRTGSFVESSPAIVDGIIYFGSNDGNFYALDANTGDILWRFRTGRTNRSSPAVAGGMVFFGSDNGYLYALDAKTGDELWSYKTISYVISSPAVANGIVYFGSVDNYIYALQATNGRFRLKVRIDSIVSSPAIKDEVIYFNSAGNLWAIDGKARNWPGEHYYRNYWLQLYLFRLAPAPPPVSGYMWNVPRLGELSASSCSPIVTGDTIYTALGRYLYAIDIETHDKLWESPFEAEDYFRSSPALGKGILYIGNENGLLYAVNANNGEKLWHFTTGDEITSSPALANGIIYITSHDGTLYAIE